MTTLEFLEMALNEATGREGLPIFPCGIGGCFTLHSGHGRLHRGLDLVFESGQGALLGITLREDTLPGENDAVPSPLTGTSLIGNVARVIMLAVSGKAQQFPYDELRPLPR